MLRLLISITCSIPWLTGTVALAEGVRVFGDQILCVAKNIETYRALDSDPLIIQLMICPKTQLDGQAIRSLARNSMPKTMAKPENEPDIVLPIAKRELDCLVVFVRTLPDPPPKIVEIPDDLCR